MAPVNCPVGLSSPVTIAMDSTGMRVARPAKSSQQPAMLKPLIPRPRAVDCGQAIPPVVLPLTTAAQDAASLSSALHRVVRDLGFDDFTVMVSDTTRPTRYRQVRSGQPARGCGARSSGENHRAIAGRQAPVERIERM